MSPSEISNGWTLLRLPLAGVGIIIWIGVFIYLSTRWRSNPVKSISVSFALALGSVLVLFAISIICFMMAQSAVDNSLH